MSSYVISYVIDGKNKREKRHSKNYLTHLLVILCEARFELLLCDR